MPDRLLPIGPGQLDIHARYNIVGEQEGNLDNGGQVDETRIVNTSLTYQWNRYRLSAYGKNLTDEVIGYGVSVGNFFSAGGQTPGRSWGIEFEAKFGNK